MAPPKKQDSLEVQVRRKLIKYRTEELAQIYNSFSEEIMNRFINPAGSYAGMRPVDEVPVLLAVPIDEALDGIASKHDSIHSDIVGSVKRFIQYNALQQWIAITADAHAKCEYGPADQLVARQQGRIPKRTLEQRELFEIDAQSLVHITHELRITQQYLLNEARKNGVESLDDTVRKRVQQKQYASRDLYASHLQQRRILVEWSMPQLAQWNVVVTPAGNKIIKSRVPYAESATLAQRIATLDFEQCEQDSRAIYP